MAFVAPTGNFTAPVDRKSPSSPTYADIPAVLDWLRGFYGGHTVIGLLITDRAAESTYRVDSESTYHPFVQGGPYGAYTLTPIANKIANPYLTPTTDGLGYTITTSLIAQTLTPTTDGLGFRVT
jgi:hypothetical protein